MKKSRFRIDGTILFILLLLLSVVLSFLLPDPGIKGESCIPNIQPKPRFLLFLLFRD